LAVAAQVEGDRPTPGPKVVELVRPVLAAAREGMDEHDRNTVARPIVIDVDLSGRSHDLAAHHGLLIGIHESSAWRGFGSVAGPLRAITAPWRGAGTLAVEPPVSRCRRPRSRSR